MRKRETGRERPVEAVVIGTLQKITDSAKECTRCPLYEQATQTVFGEGPSGASLMLVGEQPGDEEDVAGKPFIGPAGRLLDRALAEAGLDRKNLYVTNAVKHFKWIRQGKRRLHQKPKTDEINACKIWLSSEILAVRPRVIICLGTTAAKAVLGREAKVTAERGKFIQLEHGLLAFVTVHPSAILRIPSQAERHAAYQLFVHELIAAAAKAAQAAERRRRA